MTGKKHRILLVEPPFNRLYKRTYSLGRVPLSLSSLAGAVMTKKPGWWVGITAKSQNFTSGCVVAQIAKSVDKDILTVVGGPHASIARTEILKHPMIDIGVFGEGEETLVDIVDAIEGGTPFS